ncbi:MAG: hypothetical protein JW768_04310 [Chitinispirillaceae bacterium]|nr:hypothetical protein [Chitinispirillaceae bacterium]
MKKAIVLLIITFCIAGAAEDRFAMYGEFFLKTLWTQQNRFDYDSLGTVLDTVTWEERTVWGGDSIHPKMNDWFPSGIFGATFNKDVFNACIELRVGRNSYDAEIETNGSVRYVLQRYNTVFEALKWYAEWHASGNIAILTGRDYTPANFTPANRLINPLVGYGNTGRLYIGSRPMFQGSFFTGDKKITAKAALIKVDTAAIYLYKTSIENDITVNETVLPKMEASVEYNGTFSKSVGIFAKAVGGFQTYNNFVYPDRNTVPSKDSSEVRINSYLAGGEVSLKMGRLTVTPSLFAGQNLGPYGVKTGTPSTWWRLSEYQYAKNYFPIHDSLGPAGATLYNSFATEWAFSAHVELFEFLSIEAGYEDIIGSHHYPEIKEQWLNSENYGYYGQCVLTVREKLNVMVEAGSMRYGKYRGYGQYTYGGLGIGALF